MGTLTAEHSYIDHPDFARPGIAQELFGEPLPALPPAVQLEGDGFRRKAHAPTLPPVEERFRFRQFNYARRQAIHAPAQEQSLWAGRAAHVREYITRCNVALVPATLQRRGYSGDADEEYSEGMLALARAVERFDVGRGWKFSTFACQCIINALGAAYVKASKRAKRLPTAELTDAIERHVAPDRGADPELCEDVAILRQSLDANTAGLTPNEQHVIEQRFFACPKETLHAIGVRIGCSKERVRQIQVTALAKLQTALAPLLATDD